MDLKTLFFKNQLKPAWTYTVRNTLWRLMISFDGRIIIEDRDPEKKSVAFSCLIAEDGRPQWEHRDFGEPWWTGLTGVDGNRLYLHGFRKPDMPEQKNIFAVDLKSGELLWTNTECTFLAVTSQHVYGYRDLFERRVFYRLDSGTGVIQEELAELPAGIESNTQYERTNFVLPASVSEIPAPAVHGAAEHVVSAEQITIGPYAVVGVYEQNSPPAEGLKNTLSIIDTTTKKKVYSDVLNGSTPYPVPDSFFADGDRIYYIKERSILVALDLNR